MWAHAPVGFRIGRLLGRSRRLAARSGWRGSGFAAALALASGAIPAPAGAHAIVVESTPSPGLVVIGPDLKIELHFNSRIDPERSRLSLSSEEGRDHPIELPQLLAEGVLASRATGLAPGAYRLHWQVLAVDGHITRGDVAFRVVAP